MISVRIPTWFILLQILLIILRACDVITLHWAIVLAPLWVMFGMVWAMVQLWREVDGGKKY